MITHPPPSPPHNGKKKKKPLAFHIPFQFMKTFQTKIPESGYHIYASYHIVINYPIEENYRSTHSIHEVSHPLPPSL